MYVRHMCGVTLFVATWCVSGCTNDHTNQRMWANRLNFAIHAVDESTKHKGWLFTNAQLCAMAELPDYQLPAKELEDFLVPEPTYRAEVMEKLLKVHQKYALRPANRDRISESNTPGISDDFAGCWLWLYDESRHFDRPLPGTEWSGLHCIVFFIQGEKVVGVIPVGGWQPLQGEPACVPFEFFNE